LISLIFNQSSARRSDPRKGIARFAAAEALEVLTEFVKDWRPAKGTTPSATH
jgi:hypothetical protein